MPEQPAETRLVDPAHFESRIIETKVGSCSLYMLPVAVDNVVSWRGSFKSNPVFTERQDLLQNLVVSLLDKGTKRRDRFVIANVLENRGAQLSFLNGAIGVGFSGRCLKKDLTEVMAVMAEQLKEPSMEEDEFQKARMRVVASIRRSLERTGAQAYMALCRQIYGAAHPNYTLKPEEELEKLAQVTLDSLHQYHAEHFGANDLAMVVVGDIDPDEITRTVAEQLGAWAPHDSPPAYEVSTREQPPDEMVITMPDKSSIDVRIGHGLEVRMNDDEYVPLYLGNFILGGNFSSRLMDIIRDEMGLTYGIKSNLMGISRHYEGHWQVSVTLSPDKLEQGVQATKKLIEEYIDQGATQKELDEKKTTIIGSFNVELATTSGLARKILRGVKNGFGVGYLDEFPARIERTTLDEVNDELARHLDLDRVHTAIAGVSPKDV